jgi:hypothetical protein
MTSLVLPPQTFLHLISNCHCDQYCWKHFDEVRVGDTGKIGNIRRRQTTIEEPEGRPGSVNSVSVLSRYWSRNTPS